MNQISETTRWPPSSPDCLNSQPSLSLSPPSAQPPTQWILDPAATTLVPRSFPTVTVEPAAAISSVFTESAPPSFSLLRRPNRTPERRFLGRRRRIRPPLGVAPVPKEPGRLPLPIPTGLSPCTDRSSPESGENRLVFTRFSDPPFSFVSQPNRSSKRTESKILRAQPFFRTNRSLTLDQGIQGQRGGVSIIEITSVEEIMIALILFQKEARVWWEYCGQIQGEDPRGLSNPTYGDGEYLGVSSLRRFLGRRRRIRPPLGVAPVPKEPGRLPLPIPTGLSPCTDRSSPESGENRSVFTRFSDPPFSFVSQPNRSSKVEILGNVQFIGETLPKFRQKVSVFSKWARHRGMLGIPKDSSRKWGKFGAGPYMCINEIVQMSDVIRRRRAVKTTQSLEPPAQPTSAATAPALMDHLAVGPAGSQVPASLASSVGQPVSARRVIGPPAPPTPHPLMRRGHSQV
ncbi:hypothetical protein L3X38_002163 [Prunus dulcis]|uniref:Uncharacterized protein n=1 Tax=Prunus dulcis TaxID=3755 RepID=A0AAD4WWE8_PRUDU|nr:hypothetical protein L3X38_002163 [Prunus dulcis]